MPSRIPFGPLAAAALLLGAGASFGAIFETPLFTVKKVVGEVRIEKPDGTTDLVRPDYSYPYDSVLVVPATLDERDYLRPDGISVTYTLHFPRGYSQSLRGAYVTVRGDEYRVVGDPAPYTEENVRGPWTMPVSVGRSDG